MSLSEGRDYHHVAPQCKPLMQITADGNVATHLILRASLSLWRFRAGWRLAGPYLLLVAAVALYVGYRLLLP